MTTVLDARIPSLEAQIAAFLRLEQPDTYCDACLAFTLWLDVAAVRVAASSLAARSAGYARFNGECDQCDRMATVTAGA